MFKRQTGSELPDVVKLTNIDSTAAELLPLKYAKRSNVRNYLEVLSKDEQQLVDDNIKYGSTRDIVDTNDMFEYQMNKYGKDQLHEDNLHTMTKDLGLSRQLISNNNNRIASRWYPDIDVKRTYDIKENIAIPTNDEKLIDYVDFNKEYRKYSKLRGDCGAAIDKRHDKLTKIQLEAYAKPVNPTDLQKNKENLGKVAGRNFVNVYDSTVSNSNTVVLPKEKFSNFKYSMINATEFVNNEHEYSQIKFRLADSLWSDPVTRKQLELKYKTHSINDLISSTVILQDTSNNKNYILGIKKPNGIIDTLFGPDSYEAIKIKLMQLSPDEAYRLMLTQLMNERIELNDLVTETVVTTTLLKNDRAKLNFDTTKLTDGDVIESLSKSLNISISDAELLRTRINEYTKEYTFTNESDINTRNISYIDTRNRVLELANKYDAIRDYIEDLVDSTEQQRVQKYIKLKDTTANKKSILESFIGAIFGLGQSVNKNNAIVINNGRSNERYADIPKESNTKISDPKNIVMNPNPKSKITYDLFESL